MMTNFQKSTGQSNLFLNSDHNIFRKNSSIISRLNATSLTGRNLQIQVHQHLGYRLHMVWEANCKKYPSSSSSSERCLQRMIAMTNEMNKFLQELINGGSENIAA
jgi:hypothetical protein